MVHEREHEERRRSDERRDECCGVPLQAKPQEIGHEQETDHGNRKAGEHLRDDVETGDGRDGPDRRLERDHAMLAVLLPEVGEAGRAACQWVTIGSMSQSS